MEVIGRHEEKQVLEQFLQSDKPEFLAIYGRRRVGKTFLIRQFFETKKVIFFNASGTKDGKLKEQAENFMEQIGEAFFHGVVPKSVKNWKDAFKILTDAMQSVPKNKKIVLFLDEFPWMATKNSSLLQTLDYYWNQHWSKDRRVKLIICGSSASWIINKIIHNKGGLHNRVTQTICLEPFNLRDTQIFLRQSGIKLNNKQVAELYMVMGGVPHYLSRVTKGLSATQIIEKLAFSKKGFLFDEFEKLFSSLFNDYEIVIETIRVIASSRYGMGQEELFNKVDKLPKGEKGLGILRSLEDAGFVMSFMPHFHKRKGIFYKVIDEYTLFYFYWIEPIKKTLLEKGLRKGSWEQAKTSPAWYSWAGYAFEAICYKHLSQIGKTLDISPRAVVNSWRYVPPKRTDEQGAQIDLLFDREDDAITLCEIKYTNEPFYIDKAFAQKLSQKVDVFKKRTKTDKQIFWAMISASGIKTSLYSEEIIDGIVTLDDLFKTAE